MLIHNGEGMMKEFWTGQREVRGGKEAGEWES